ncbi:MAG: sulfite exporter TauE/SafE family protein [Chloroflexi bacterium]|nr:sulfite exporter TauE/SafE family protein [Chloroflexota bacterium]
MESITEATVLTALFLGFLLGVKHALDADHIVAVTTIVSRSRSLPRSLLTGLSWGIGHTLTLLAAGFGVLVFKLTIPDKLALSMELVVGIILILLGVPLVIKLVRGRIHAHAHRHDGRLHLHPHSHQEMPDHDHKHVRRPLLIGMVHGLAGSGALTMLVLGAMSSVAQGLLFLLLFGMGSIIGMLLFSGLIAIPFRLTAGVSLRLHQWFQGAAGIVSITLGFVIIWQIGFTAGLFFPAS